MLNVRLPEELEAKLNEHAKQTQRSKTSLTVEALERHFGTYSATADAKRALSASKANLNAQAKPAHPTGFKCPARGEPLASATATCNVHNRKAVPA